MNKSRFVARVLAVAAATAGSGSVVWASTALANTVPHPHSAPIQAAASAKPTPNQPSFIFLPPWPDEEE